MSLKYETIEAATLGDESAINEVLIEYEPLMLFLSIIVRRDANGKQEKVFSEDANIAGFAKVADAMIAQGIF